MENESVQDKIRGVFVSKIQTYPEFTEDEVKQIDSIITSSQTADKMVDELAKAIGGAIDENS